MLKEPIQQGPGIKFKLHFYERFLLNSRNQFSTSPECSYKEGDAIASTAKPVAVESTAESSALRYPSCSLFNKFQHKCMNLHPH